MNRDEAYLAHILDSIRKIESFTAGMSAPEFSKDEKTQSAVILQLMLIGEMAKRVSDTMRIEVPLPWKEITGFRDRAIHNYYDIDLDIVWQAVLEDVPSLKAQLKASARS